MSFWDLGDAVRYTASVLTSLGGNTADGAETALVAGLPAGRGCLNVHSSFAPGGRDPRFSHTGTRAWDSRACGRSSRCTRRLSVSNRHKPATESVIEFSSSVRCVVLCSSQASPDFDRHKLVGAKLGSRPSARLIWPSVLGDTHAHSKLQVPLSCPCSLLSLIRERVRPVCDNAH
jgi:hypothetical protein